MAWFWNVKAHGGWPMMIVIHFVEIIIIWFLFNKNPHQLASWLKIQTYQIFIFRTVVIVIALHYCCRNVCGMWCLFQIGVTQIRCRIFFPRYQYPTGISLYNLYQIRISSYRFDIIIREITQIILFLRMCCRSLVFPQSNSSKVSFMKIDIKLYS